MAITRFDKPAEMPELDFRFLFGTKQYYDKLGKEALDEANEVSTKAAAINALPQDKALRNKKLAEYESRNNAWYEKYKNNLSAGLGELRTIKQDFYRDMTRGQLAAIQSNYNARAAHEEEVNKLYNAGKINQQRRDALLQYDLMGYKGVGQENPEGRYNSYSGTTAAEEVDIPKVLNEWFTGWQAEKVASGKYKAHGSDEKGLYFIRNDYSKEYVPASEIEKHANNLMRNDFKMKSFIDQETKLSTANIDPDATYQMTDASGKPVQKTGKDLIDNYRESFYRRGIEFAKDKFAYTRVESKEADMTFAPESWRKTDQGTAFLTNNLNSVKIPTVEQNKVKVMGNYRPYTDAEKRDIYSKYNLLNSDGTLKTVMGTSLERAQAEIELGAPISTVQFTPEQEVIFARTGKTARNDKEKAEIINKYLDDFNRQLIFPGIKAYDWSDKPTAERAKREQEMFFGKEGSSLYLTRNYELLSGDGPNKLTGSELSQQYGDDKKYTKVVTGFVQPDNPSKYTTGRLVTIKDAKSGEIVSTYIMSGSDQEENDPRNKVIHSMSQARYNPTGSTYVNIALQEGNTVSNRQYVVSYDQDPKTKLEVVQLTDPMTNRVIKTVQNDGSTGQSSFELLFNSLSGDKNAARYEVTPNQAAEVQQANTPKTPSGPPTSWY